MTAEQILDEPIWIGWSLGREGAKAILKLLDKHQPKLILDVGSGASTILFAAWAGENNARVVSLEHEKLYADATKKELKKYGLKAELKVRPLIQFRQGWFYAAHLPSEIDFCLIDGPPGTYGRGASLYQIFPHLADNYLVVLDDANREGEKKILKQWKDDFPIKVRKNRLNHRLAEITWA